MPSEELFERVLARPAREGCDELLVVGGYSSAAMLDRHLNGGADDRAATALPGSVRLRVLHGMYPASGINRIDHERFLTLDDADRVRVRYRAVSPPCHAKVYLWSRDGKPERAFAGSANYSQNAFNGANVEVLLPVAPESVEAFCRRMWDEAISIRAVGRPAPLRVIRARTMTGQVEEVIIPLAIRGGATMPETSGINWNAGPKRVHRSDSDAAYLSVSHHRDSPGFFPRRGSVFVARFDDGVLLDMKTISGKKRGAGPDQYGGITTLDDNQILGRYLRGRIGRAIGENLMGEFVTLNHLKAYGRDSIAVRRTGEDVYEFDFSRPR